jgi:hypothetical protein
MLGTSNLEQSLNMFDREDNMSQNNGGGNNKERKFDNMSPGKKLNMNSWGTGKFGQSPL